MNENTKRALSKMTWAELEKHKQNIPFFILPTGSMEQHGLHLPLGADTMVASKIAAETASIFNAVQLPVASVGANFAFKDWPGTISISFETYIKMIIDICTTASKWCNRIMIINGHDENQALLLIAIREVVEKLGIKIVLFEWAQLVRSTLRFVCDSKTEMHAGEGLTSLFLYWFPEDVRMDRIINGETGLKGLMADDVHIDGSAHFPIMLSHNRERTGVWGNPSLANREKGQKIATALLEHVKQLVQELEW